MIGRIASGIALASMAGLMLAGCAPGDPVETSVTTTPTAESPSPSPQLREDEVAEAAMETAQQFYALVDRAFASGELPVEELGSVAGPEAIEKVEAELDRFIAMGWRVEGESLLDSPVLESWAPAGSGAGVAELLLCLDTSSVTMSNSEGEPIGGDDPRQPRRFTLELVSSGMRVADFGPVADSVEMQGCGS